MLNILLTILTVAFLFILGCFIILNSLEERYRELEDEENVKDRKDQRRD